MEIGENGMKAVVIYKSKTGYTKKYAEWIAEDLACESRSIKGVKLDDLKNYGLVIYGGGVYAGMIAGLGKVKNWMEKSPDKTWIIFATGASPHAGAAQAPAQPRQDQPQ